MFSGHGTGSYALTSDVSTRPLLWQPTKQISQVCRICNISLVMHSKNI